MQVFADGATLDAQLGLPSPTALFFADGMQLNVQGNLTVMGNITNEVEVFTPDGTLTHPSWLPHSPVGIARDHAALR